ncbi:putative C6 finger domain protein [Aspergillus clavatus NRRL 1]|uniref:C6 zinc finger domain protein n=1 Tax=Aspergillus clavatus (strain ATCC 1007 / CBS 513.65 / DSM 816 / NCTC 3887 / NRRL 1 / QM 1276 / 107) TaxID=344612 RepID=A1C7E3_ASPCL|nr:C6 zinc finger domain protein [Aspergillus clavatus NRRL 1]EAW14314.1 C6 zinc finger domain protein [Aspergillus clavatus NRRL 1]
MNFTSDAGKAFLASLPISEEETRPQDNDQWTKYWDIPDSVADSGEASGYLLRKREAPQVDKGCCVDLEEPVARGCWSCRNLQQDCSLVDKSLVYPCQTCKEDEIECELIIPPEWKRACERCRRSKKSCSYNHGETDHSLPCEQCRAMGMKCIAGPAKDKPPQKAKITTEEAELETHVPTATTPGTIWDTIPPLPSNGELLDPLFVPLGSEIDLGSLSNNLGQPSTSSIHTIQTSLAHPVNFTYEPPSDGSSPCHWCSNFAYGIMGLGKRTVEVIDFGDGRYVEVGGGHVSEGHEPSRMCVICALERIHVVNCPGHRIVPLRGYKVETFDFKAAYNSMVPVPGQTPKRTNPWCSLCPNPAFFGCGTLQTVNKYQEPVAPSSPDVKGCGLLLCDRCELLMRAFRGDLTKVVAKNEQGNAEFGSRADVNYILPGNDLYRCYTGT